jgi:hypothetical protein
MHPSLREEKWKRSGQPGQEKPADRRPAGCARELAFSIADQEGSPANWTVNGRRVGVDPVAASFYIEALPYAILIGPIRLGGQKGTPRASPYRLWRPD